MPSPPVAIHLEFDSTGDSLAGRASDGTGAERPFVGWLGLMAAIEALLPGGPSPAASIAAPERPGAD